MSEERMATKHKLRLSKIVKHVPFFDSKQIFRYSSTATYTLHGTNTKLQQPMKLTIKLSNENYETNTKNTPEIWVLIKGKKHPNSKLKQHKKKVNQWPKQY